jgi:hypothetical protein
MGVSKGEDGKYHIKGKTYELNIGSRAQVWHGTAYKTSGGLNKTELLQTQRGRIVSRAKHNTAKKENRLLAHGYGFTKGKFGTKRITPSHGKSRKTRGGVILL